MITEAQEAAQNTEAIPPAIDWSEIAATAHCDLGLESYVETTLEQMTIDEKLGQMIQAEVQQLHPTDIETYKIGSALNGAGVWPTKDRYSSPAAWASMIDAYWTASKQSFSQRPFDIPFAWATDAVHGHNNLFNATVFPHNIGLGATRDPDLLRRIGEITASELSASGMDWTFAPTVAIPLDARWGRFYEGYSQDPAIVSVLAGEMVLGLQGKLGTAVADSVLSSIKHWIGDGGTRWGIDRGVNFCSEEDLYRLHAVGYQAALKAGAQVVMVSFSSWNHENNYDHAPNTGLPYNYKLHGSHYLITEVLKKQMRFDGIVLTDWDGHCEISKCSLKDARYCINAGADVLMVEARGDWLAILDQTKRDLAAGFITQARIDDAVRRVLRVKQRAALKNKQRPVDRAAVRKASQIVGSAQHRSVAREAVRKSVVLLKNDNDLLPLHRQQRILAAGSALDSLSKQLGGWSLHWHSNELAQEEFPTATTLLQSLQQELPVEQLSRYQDEMELDRNLYDVAIVAIGEDAYSEMLGDIRPWNSLEYAALKPSYAQDLALLRRLNGAGIPIVCVYFGGRPLYLNKEINLATSFLVTWLPGIAGEGITDVILRSPDSKVQNDFLGRLSCAWPATPFGFRLSKSYSDEVSSKHPKYDGDSEILFPIGYGLSVNETSSTNLGALPLYREELDAPPPRAKRSLVFLGPNEDARYTCRIAGNGFWVGADVSRVATTEALLGRVEPLSYLGDNDALRVYFNGRIASLYLQLPHWDVEDMRGYLSAAADLVFDLRMHTRGKGPVRLSAHNCFPSVGVYDATSIFASLPLETWAEVRLPLSSLAATGSDFRQINVPFMLHTEAELRFDIGHLRWDVSQSQ